MPPKYTEQDRYPVIAVDVIVFNKENKILLTRRAIEPQKGKWSIIGERIETSDDSIEASVKRGLEEETGLAVEVENLVDVVGDPQMKPAADPRFYVVQVLYTARVIAGEVQVTSEADEFRWVDLDGALKEDLAFNHHQLLEIYKLKKEAKALIPAERSKYTEMYGQEISYSQSLYPRLAVDSIIFNDQNEILLARRFQWPYVGHWDFPGGHIYVNETIAECQKREVKEELGVDSEPGELFQVYSDKGQSPKVMDVVAFYFAKIKSADFIKNVEMDDFAFFPLDKLPEKIAYHHERALTDLKKYLKI